MPDGFLDYQCLLASRISVWFCTDSHGSYLKSPVDVAAVGHLSALCNQCTSLVCL